MRTGNIGTARSAFYDRNPKSIFFSFSGNYNPHAVTNRGTYTVPVNRSAKIEVIHLYIARYPQLVTTLQFAYGLITYTPSGGAQQQLGVVFNEDQSAFSADRYAVSEGGTLMAGDKIDLWTFDGSTGGQCWYTLFVKLLEFDA